MSGVGVLMLCLWKEYSRQVMTAEGQKFAERMGSLFIEASAKTAVGVTEVFTQLVEKIMETPELWSNSTEGQSTSGGNGGMPGGVQVVEPGVDNVRLRDGGCAC